MTETSGCDTAKEADWTTDPIEEAARRTYGVAGLYPIQRFVIANTLEGLGQIVILPTGAGKSLCWQVPLAFLQGPTLVVFPLLALLADQVRRLSARAVPLAVLRGGLSAAERAAVARAVHGRLVRLLVATPEALAAPWAVRLLAGVRIAHLVVDEAHCIPEWGPRFRPAYLGLGERIESLHPAVVTAFTATASRSVVEAISRTLFPADPPRLVADDADRPNIFYRVLPSVCPTRDVAAVLAARPGAALVFGPTRGEVELLAHRLAARLPWRRVVPYHAGLPREGRKQAEDWFLYSSDGVLVATSAYGMGVDKPDICTVVHTAPPHSVESYLQESGRAGRDGRPAEAILIREIGGESRLPEEPTERIRARAMLGYASDTSGCRREYLLRLLGQGAPVCSGCDTCRGTAASAALGEREILEWARRNRRRFTLRGAVLALQGRSTGRPMLPGWDADEILAALRSLIRAGALRCTRGPLWRGRLTVAPHGFARPTVVSLKKPCA